MKISSLFAVIVILLSLSINQPLSADIPKKIGFSRIYKYVKNFFSPYQKQFINLEDDPTLSIEENDWGDVIAFKAIISDHCGNEYGYVMFNYDKTSKAAHIETLYVRSEFRKKSFGSLLLTFALQTLTECKCTIVTWIASPFNLKEGEDSKLMLPKLIAFYQRHGAVVTQQREWNAEIAYYPKTS